MVIADVAVMPLLPAESEEQLYGYVDEVIDYIRKSGLKYEVGAMSTTIEGEYDDVFDLLKKIHKMPFNSGCTRVITVIRIDEKIDGLSIDEKLKNHIGKRTNKE
ncbi:MTH1187 family thiamine-binding protein [Clostridium oryzae]|uniref:Thiamine-binding protein domain-containing protein n=1 Tax=Clostridium oryzae TaxID=1450648 RepID=A0A1V4ILR9_9CLOT|nr:MTH1187 family thiamine-binding protein [Clostridium oryzae]OPJ60843.1 hypothetical protein CLORY_25500 [Clostridium oryzae]